MKVSYSVAKEVQKILETECTKHEIVLKAAPRGKMGLTLPEAKTAEWVAAKNGYAAAFAALRNFNRQFSKLYKKEIAEERAERRSSWQAAHVEA